MLNTSNVLLVSREKDEGSKTMAKPGKVNKTPEGLAKAAEKAGHKVEKINHGWLIYPQGGGKSEWLSRNTGGRGQKNNEAVAKRLGIL
jgi:hypothetical protein